MMPHKRIRPEDYCAKDRKRSSLAYPRMKITPPAVALPCHAIRSPHFASSRMSRRFAYHKHSCLLQIMESNESEHPTSNDDYLSHVPFRGRNAIWPGPGIWDLRPGPWSSLAVHSWHATKEQGKWMDAVYSESSERTPQGAAFCLSRFC